MTDVSTVPASVGIAAESIVLPMQIEAQVTVGMVSPVQLVANNWNGYELGNTRLDRITRFEMSPGMNQGGPEGMSPNMQRSPRQSRFYSGRLKMSLRRRQRQKRRARQQMSLARILRCNQAIRTR